MLHGEDESKNVLIKQKKYFQKIPLMKDCLFKSKQKNFKNKNLSDLIIFIKLESSKSEIKRLIKNNGIKINNLKDREDLAFSKYIFRK